MNIEEKNLPENEAPVENTYPEEPTKKKLSPGVLAAIIGGAVVLVGVIVLVIVLLVGGKKCDGHIDKDDDYLCDKCGANYDDGDEVPEVITGKVNFTVKLDNGQTLSGIEFTLTRGEQSFDIVSGADGSAEIDLEVGNYSVSYNYDSLPEYCTPDTFSFKVEEGGNSVTLTITDNRPDGSAEKPFFISENTTEITVEPGKQLYFNYRGSSLKYVKVHNAAAVVVYNGQEYPAVDGVTNAALYPEIGVLTTFAIKNTSTQAFTATMELVAPLGSNENPIAMTEGSASALTSAEEIVYYSWQAEKAGVLVLTSSTEKNSIALTKILENDISITTQTGGSNAAYIAVSAGDNILIGVSMLDAKEKVEVNFAVAVYEGTEADPVPVLKKEIDISLSAGASLVFSVESYEGKHISITDESSVSLLHGSESYSTADGSGIYAELTGPVFTVTNNSDRINGITIKIQ